MGRNAFLDFPGAQTVPRHIDHIIGATEDEVVAILVSYTPVKGAVDQLAWHAAPVGFDKPLVIAPNRLHATRRQRAFNGHHAFLVRLGQLLAGLVIE